MSRSFWRREDHGSFDGGTCPGCEARGHGMPEILDERSPREDLLTIAEHLARHGRGGRVSRALWALVERQARPYKVIYDDGGSPYLLRVYQTRHTQHQPGEVTEERRLPAVYLHYFFRGDLDRELHNHPWEWAVSVILSGGYTEERYDGPLDLIEPRRVRARALRPGSVNVIRHDTYHRVQMLNGTPTWSLFIAGPRVAKTRGEDWGFVSPQTREYESWGARDARRLAVARTRVDPVAVAPARDHVCLACGFKQYQSADGFCAHCGGDSTVVTEPAETLTDVSPEHLEALYPDYPPETICVNCGRRFDDDSQCHEMWTDEPCYFTPNTDAHRLARIRQEAQHLLRLGMAPEEIENAVRQTALLRDLKARQ